MPETVHTAHVVPAWLQAILLLFYFVVCLALVLCVMFTTTKNEGGLTGVIGGSSQSTIFKGKKSAEEMMSVWTTRLAWTFLGSSLVIWMILAR